MNYTFIIFFAAELLRRQKSFFLTFFFFLGRFLSALRLPLLKLALAFFGFKEGADVGKHIVHDGLQDVFWHIAFGTAVAERVFEFNAQARPKSAVFVCLNVFPVRLQPFGNGFFKLPVDLRRPTLAEHFRNPFLAVLLFHFSQLALNFKYRVLSLFCAL